MLTGQLALVTAALFAGAALYINAAEHPVRLTLDPRSQLAQWKPSYGRGYTMQASLAAVSGLLGLWTWWMANDGRWIVGALLILANWPFTLISMMPTNHKLSSVNEERADAGTVALLKRWGRLHAVRTILGLAAVAAYFWALN